MIAIIKNQPSEEKKMKEVFTLNSFGESVLICDQQKSTFSSIVDFFGVLLLAPLEEKAYRNERKVSLETTLMNEQAVGSWTLGRPKQEKLKYWGF